MWFEKLHEGADDRAQPRPETLGLILKRLDDPTIAFDYDSVFGFATSWHRVPPLEDLAINRPASGGGSDF